LRILYVTSTLPFGAGESFVIPEICELLRRGHDVRIIPIRPRNGIVHVGIDELLERSVPTPLLSGRVLMGASRSLVRFGSQTLRAAAGTLDEGTKVVRLKNACVLPKALWLAAEAKAFEADHIHAHWASTTSTAAMVAAALADVPWSFTAHRWDIAEENLLERKAASAAFVRAISADGAGDLRSRIGDRENIVELHMGVDLPERPAERPTTGTPFTVFVPALLVPVKGHDVLLRALALPGPADAGMRAVLAGGGPLLASLHRLAAQLGIAERVDFLGQLPHDEVLMRLTSGSYDLVAMPSVNRDGEKEGIPVALVEAMAHGVPVVASDIGGVSELLGRGAGMLVAPADEHALANVLCKLAADIELRRSLALVGRRRVEEEFSITSVADRLVELFQGAAAERDAA
jgi:colanic acid/amylovoran biosynthesis glycosyltransferase